MPMTAAIATAAMMATSVVMKDVGSSGSIGVAGVSAGPTFIAVAATELP